MADNYINQIRTNGQTYDVSASYAVRVLETFSADVLKNGSFNIGANSTTSAYAGINIKNATTLDLSANQTVTFKNAYGDVDTSFNLNVGFNNLTQIGVNTTYINNNHNFGCIYQMYGPYRRIFGSWAITYKNIPYNTCIINLKKSGEEIEPNLDTFYFQGMIFPGDEIYNEPAAVTTLDWAMPVTLLFYEKAVWWMGYHDVALDYPVTDGRRNRTHSYWQYSTSNQTSNKGRLIIDYSWINQTQVASQF